MLALILIFNLVWGGTALAGTAEGRHWYKQAQILYQQGDLDRALALLEEIPKRFSQDHSLLVEAASLRAKIYYKKGAYKKVIDTLKPLMLTTSLPAEDLLLLAQSANKLGLYDEALMYVSLMQKKYPGQKKCQAVLLEACIYDRRQLKEKACSLAQEILSQGCPLEAKAKALDLLLRNGEKITKYLSFIEEHPRLYRYQPSILRHLALYHLKQGNLKQAEEEIYAYLNYSGNQQEAPALLFRIAEAYFQHKNYRKARRLYELVYTSWPSAKEALFAKFRLYHMRYIFEEKIGHKSPYTRRLLLAICALLKKDYPQNPLTEEAHALEITLLLEAHQPEKALASIWSFLKRYPKSRYLPKVYQCLCKASSPVDQRFLAAKDYLGLIDFHLAHKKDFLKARCGLHYYWLSQAYQGLNLTTSATLALLKARDFGVPNPWLPNVLLNLSDLLLQRGEKQDPSTACQILDYVAQKFPESVVSPYYQFLKGFYLYREGHYPEALIFMNKAFATTADAQLKKRIQKIYLDTLLKGGRLEEALKIIKPTAVNYQLYLKRLILLALGQDKLNVAQKASVLLIKVSAKDKEALWLRALVLERLGEEKEAQKLWTSLANGPQEKSVFVKLASDLVRASYLVERARGEIY